MNDATPTTRSYHIGPHGFIADTLPAGLYLVATPIGNLGDVSIRALQTLAGVNAIYCEDTRVSIKLLDRFGIRNKLKSYHDHNSEHAGHAIISDINAGHAIALCSDAGTPLISDPGFPLVRDCLAAGLKVEALPGASALLPALQLSGFPTDRFCFLGFLPQKHNERLKFLRAVEARTETVVLYESPYRILATLADMQEILGERGVSVSREISKLHEETLRGTSHEIALVLAARPSIKGEFVIVVAAIERPPDIFSDTEIQNAIEAMLTDHTAGKTASLVSKKYGLPRDEVYARILAFKGKA